MEQPFGNPAGWRALVQDASASLASSSEGAPPAKLDTVNFSFADRAAAWFTGTGKELKMLKEVLPHGKTKVIPAAKLREDIATESPGGEGGRDVLGQARKRVGQFFVVPKA